MENTKKCKVAANDGDKEKKSLIAEEEEKNVLQAEEFPDEFQCCICLDLLYKPVVLGCGHLSCFWCVHKAMSICYESHCPICRHPYNHFPSICQLLHLLLQKLYPVAYESRKRQVREEEKKIGYFSPATHKLFGSCPSKESNILDIHQPSHANFPAKSYLEDYSEKGESSSNRNSSGETMHQQDDSSVRSERASNSSEIAENETIQKYNLLEDDIEHGAYKQVTVSDFQCAACKKLLFRPVVLNCGHVYCESCICGSESGIIKCEVCQSLHPNGFPSVCLTIERFLEEQFPDIYAERRETLLKQTDRSGQAQPQTSQSLSSVLSDVYSSWWWGNKGPKVHIGVGCDSCGIPAS
ncbi:E3 ubiquitin-protein ligase PRT1-like isoform X2 [Carica papaya]|uniref:E3 ubiquitin-protein ligase PRT1-like isoform X2 n=1 Tax=Carica papaya TaxID=3649 RepID=UPI000B8CB136|nr:E3 ubiquitin-protein ligase PRT1-like isoform X2 [Carica papaya]